MSRAMRPWAFVLAFALPVAVWADEPGEGAPELDEVEEKERHPEHDWEANVDFVYGTSRFETVGPDGKSGSTIDTSRVGAISFLFGLEREITKAIVVGARIPLVTGAPDTIRSREMDLPTRSVGPVFGNLEIEGMYKRTLVDSKWHAAFEGALEIALPLAPGTEPPRDVDANAMYPYDSMDRFALLRAASFTRGTLDSALFEPGRFGVVPKVSLPMKFLGNRLKVRPTVKFEALLDTTGRAREPAIGELVMGLRASYEIVPWLEPGVHVWTNITVSKSEEQDLTVAVIEPSVYGHFGPISPYAGIIIPMAGHLVTKDTLAFRLGVAAGF